MIVVLILVVVPGIYLKSYFKNMGNEMIDILNDMNSDIDKGINPNKDKSEALIATFKEKEDTWILLIDHESLDELEAKICECAVFYEYNEEFEFKSVYKKTINTIEDIYKREEISAINIF